MPSGLDSDSAVDVLCSDQRLRYGRVVDVAEEGLFVDLLCPNRRREFAPFGSVFFPRPTSSKHFDRFDTNQSSASVEILVPESPSGPWIWLPGEISCRVNGGPRALDGGAVVSWKRPDSGMLCTDYLPVQRIHPVPDSNNNAALHRCARPGSFVKGSVNLGKEFRSLSKGEAEALIRRLNRYRLFNLPDVFFVAFMNDRLEYIYRLPEGTTFSKNQLEARARLRYKLFSKITSPTEEETANAEMARMLPVVLWQEVFGSLDTVTQTKLRAVCTTWNRILETPALRSTIIVRGNYDNQGPFGHYPSLAAINHFLRSGTQRVAVAREFAGERMSLFYVEMVRDMIRYVADQQTGIRLSTLFLHGVRLESRVGRGDYSGSIAGCVLHQLKKYPGYYWLHDTLTKCCSGIPCNTIHLASCVAALACRFRSTLPLALPPKYPVQLEITVGSVKLQRCENWNRALWDALEAAVAMPSEAELHALARRLKAGWKAADNFLVREAVCQVLCVAQSSDPRPSSHYRGKKWCRDGLRDLRWKKLSRITLHFLVVLQNAL